MSFSGETKGYVDEGWNRNSDECGMGWTFTCTYQTTLFQNFASRGCVGSALGAEALAMKRAMEDAFAAGLHELDMFSDSQVLIFLINSGKSTIDLKRLL